MIERMRMHENAAKLVPELAAWNNGKGIELLGWLTTFARYDHAAAYLAFFWPDFFLHDDCILRGGPHVESYQDWMRQYPGQRTRIERVMNHCHIVDMFPYSEIEPARDLVIHLSEVIKDMWTCKIQRDFPERRAKVEAYGLDSDNLLDVQITVYQDRT